MGLQHGARAAPGNLNTQQICSSQHRSAGAGASAGYRSVAQDLPV